MANARQWFDSEDVWETFAPMVFSTAVRRAAPADVDNIARLVNLTPGSHVLDMPCGPGRHTVELLRRGYRVTGVDRTQKYLDEAKAAADTLEDSASRAEFIRSDMREFARPGAFDAALNLYTSLGYFEDANDDLRVLRNYYASLKPGGVLVIDIMGKEVLSRIFRERDWRELPGGDLVLEERRVNADWTWIDNRWIHIRGGQRRDYSLGLRLFDAASLSALVREAGFAELRVFGSLAGEPYNHTATRLVITARRS